MPVYEITYRFDEYGGNVLYQTTQCVESDATDANLEPAWSLIETGLTIEDECIIGLAYVQTEEMISAQDVFQSATTASRVQTIGQVPLGGTDQQTTSGPIAPDDAVQRFRQQSDTDLVARISASCGRGHLLSADLTPYNPVLADCWFVGIDERTIDSVEEFSRSDIVDFYLTFADRFCDDPSTKLAVYRPAASDQVHLARVVPSPTRPKSCYEVGMGEFGAVNFHQLELSKVRLVVGETTHGPGQPAAPFRSAAGDIKTSQDLYYQAWCNRADVAAHPLGILADGELYRPITPHSDDNGDQDTSTGPANSEPLPVASHRGSSSTPWQFGLTRYDGAIILTMARAGPSKFDPVLKRFPIESLQINEPVIFTSTFTRCVWQEDPANPMVKSRSSEGQRFRLLYRTGSSWHVAVPEADNEATNAESDTGFEQTQIPGTSIRSTKTQTTDGDKHESVIEREYRLSPTLIHTYDEVYALTYDEAETEAVDRLEWDIRSGTAYALTGQDSPSAVESDGKKSKWTKDEQEVIERAGADTEQEKNLALAQARLVGKL